MSVADVSIQRLYFIGSDSECSLSLIHVMEVEAVKCVTQADWASRRVQEPCSKSSKGFLKPDE